MRLIDADALMTYCNNLKDKKIDANDIARFPTAKEQDNCENCAIAIEDRQPIVRCKDCKYCFVEGFVNEHNFCDKHEYIKGQPDNWFCADGER